MLKVLIVDNEVAIRKGLLHCLHWEDLGCTIVGQAQDGIEALELIESLSPHILISDIRMPEMDGIELARKVRTDYPSIKTIILTGYPDFSYAQKAIAFGVVDFVLKPTTSESLTHAIGLAKKRIYDEQTNWDIAQELEGKTEQNLELQRSILLRELIEYADPSMLYTLTRVSSLGLKIGSYHLLNVFVGLPESEDENIDFAPLLAEVRTILGQSLQPLAQYWVACANQSYHVVVGGAHDDELLAKCNEAAEIARGFLRYAVSIGISDMFTDPLQMPLAAQMAKDARQFAAYSSESMALSHAQMPAAQGDDVLIIRQELQGLRSAIEYGKYNDARLLLDNMFLIINKTKLPLKEVGKVGLFVYHACVEPLFFREGASQQKEGLPAQENVLNAQSAENLHKNLRNLLLWVQQHGQKQSEDAQEAVQIIKTHIRRNYHEEITLENMANMVYLSPGYLSKLFKREAGENLTSYIQNIRIEKAKELLLSSTLKTYEVGEKVGIQDPVYFSRLFKKITGIKPKDYRNEGKT